LEGGIERRGKEKEARRRETGTILAHLEAGVDIIG